MSEPPLRVMLVDDHQVVRDGIKLLLNDVDDVVVCAEASSAREAVAVATQALPDVIVMDIRLSDGSGIEATRDIRAARPQTSVLMLTSFADDEALSNVSRHAEAATCRVSLYGDEDGGVLEVDDDGRGFDPASVSGAGQGLRNLRERAEGLGGRAEIDSTPGQGTRVRVTIPR